MFIISAFLDIVMCPKSLKRFLFPGVLVESSESILPKEQSPDDTSYPRDRYSRCYSKYAVDLGFDSCKHLGFKKVTKFYLNIYF